MSKKIHTGQLLPPFEDLFKVEVLKQMILREEARYLSKEIEGENLHIFIGSSGAGRDTILEECLIQIENSNRLRRTTTREKRQYITDQERMLFITESSFLRDFKKGEILFAGRYKANGRLYGISKKELYQLKDKVDYYHFLEENFSGLPVKLMLPKSKLIIVLPPTVDVLRDRLFSRDKKHSESLSRFETSVKEIKTVLRSLPAMIKNNFVDMVVINEGFPSDVAKRVTRAIKRKEKLIEDFSKLVSSLKRSY
ncbi:MAG: hypothetical protein Q8P80_03730 [Candidatus Levybacteria bacterium]|nr:hypothetical protein [Candidatus Levybacteria bacterium]